MAVAQTIDHHLAVAQGSVVHHSYYLDFIIGGKDSK